MARARIVCGLTASWHYFICTNWLFFFYVFLFFLLICRRFFLLNAKSKQQSAKKWLQHRLILEWAPIVAQAVCWNHRAAVIQTFLANRKLKWIAHGRNTINKIHRIWISAWIPPIQICWSSKSSMKSTKHRRIRSNRPNRCHLNRNRLEMAAVALAAVAAAPTMTMAIMSTRQPIKLVAAAFHPVDFLAADSGKSNTNTPFRVDQFRNQTRALARPLSHQFVRIYFAKIHIFSGDHLKTNNKHTLFTHTFLRQLIWHRCLIFKFFFFLWCAIDCFFLWI